MQPDSPSYKWWMALTVVPAGLISGIDGTSVGIALPSMMVSLGADLDQIQWVVSASLIIQTLLMPMAGWLTGLLGSRNLFVACLLLFTAGTVLCSFAWNAESLIFFRAVQGLGGGPLQPVSMALLYSVFPPTQRGTAVGLFNLSTALGLTIGRFAGFLVEAFDWRMIFYMTLPFGAFSAVLGFVLLPKAEPRQQWSIDVWGLLTMAGFLVPLLVALTQGRHAGWDSASIRALFALACVSCIAFLAVEWRSTAPLVELRLYKNFDFAMGSIVNVMATGLFMSSTFLINIFLQQVYQFTPAQVGVLTFPQGVVYGIVSLVSGRLADVADPRVPRVLGLACFAPVYYWLGSISALATASALMGMLCLRSVSFSSVNAPNMLLSLQSLPEDKGADGDRFVLRGAGGGGDLRGGVVGRVLGTPAGGPRAAASPGAGAPTPPIPMGAGQSAGPVCRAGGWRWSGSSQGGSAGAQHDAARSGHRRVPGCLSALRAPVAVHHHSGAPAAVCSQVLGANRQAQLVSTLVRLARWCS